MSEYIVGMRDIVKDFPGIRANDHVTLQLRRGEIHALLGENGMAALVTWLMAHFELLLSVGIVALSGLMLPPDMLGDAARELWEIIRRGDNT